jgi:hypothetical protein
MCPKYIQALIYSLVQIIAMIENSISFYVSKGAVFLVWSSVVEPPLSVDLSGGAQN